MMGLAECIEKCPLGGEGRWLVKIRSSTHLH
ncbi:hypothetical protein OR1_03056 [Geobacter sp. OR-1]|nr:hypothetical protein OR1_03056 [Geobacter sp. OR-1]